MFSDKNFYKKLTKLTIPIAFQSLMLAMVAAADAVMLGARYLKIAGWSYLLTGISQCYLAMMKVTEHATRTAWMKSENFRGYSIIIRNTNG